MGFPSRRFFFGVFLGHENSSWVLGDGGWSSPALPQDVAWQFDISSSLVKWGTVDRKECLTLRES